MTPPRFLPLSADDHRHLLNIARGLLGHPADAEDAVHDAYLRALTSAPDLVEVPLAWLTTVLRHVAIDTLRKRQRDAGQPGAADMPDLAPSAQQLAERAQDSRRALRGLSERLSPDDAALLLLREVFGESHAAIAARIGKSEAACRQSVHRSLARLRAAPGKHEPDDRATADALYALCLRALQTHSPAPLYAILASPVTARVGAPQGAAGLAATGSPPRSGIVQVNGRYALVLAHAGHLLCCMALGPLTPEEADSRQPVAC